MFCFKSILNCSHNSVCHRTRFAFNNNNLLQLLLFFTLLLHTQYRLFFNTEIFKTQLYSSHTTCLHTILTKFLLNRRCLLLPFISQDKEFDECTWRRIFLPSWILYKCKEVACSIVVFGLFVYPLLYRILFLYWRCCYIFIYSLIM